MILAEEYGIRIHDPLPSKLRLSSLTPRTQLQQQQQPRDWDAVDIWFRITGGECKDEFVSLSHESEHDLAVMVSDFMENGSGGRISEGKYSSDSDSTSSDLSHLAELASFHKRAMDQYESDLLSTVHSLLLSIKEVDLHTVTGDGQCNASCIRQSLVKMLRMSGYDAAVCSSKWQSHDKVPGGDHEYIDVVKGSVGSAERLIIDIDFRSHFEIARALKAYDAILTSLPVIYVGSLSRLEEFLQIMADAAKYSLKKNSMPVPPWRSLSYLQAKWHSKYERKPSPERENVKHISFSNHRQCIGHLRRLKASLQSEIESERLLKPITNDKKRMAKLERQKPSLFH